MITYESLITTAIHQLMMLAAMGSAVALALHNSISGETAIVVVLGAAGMSSAGALPVVHDLIARQSPPASTP